MRQITKIFLALALLSVTPELFAQRASWDNSDLLEPGLNGDIPLKVLVSLVIALFYGYGILSIFDEKLRPNGLILTIAFTGGLILTFYIAVAYPRTVILAGIALPIFGFIYLLILTFRKTDTAEKSNLGIPSGHSKEDLKPERKQRHTQIPSVSKVVSRNIRSERNVERRLWKVKGFALTRDGIEIPFDSLTIVGSPIPGFDVRDANQPDRVWISSNEIEGDWTAIEAQVQNYQSRIR